MFKGTVVNDREWKSFVVSNETKFVSNDQISKSPTVEFLEFPGFHYAFHLNRALRAPLSTTRDHIPGIDDSTHLTGASIYSHNGSAPPSAMLRSPLQDE